MRLSHGSVSAAKAAGDSKAVQAAAHRIKPAFFVRDWVPAFAGTSGCWSAGHPSSVRPRESGDPVRFAYASISFLLRQSPRPVREAPDEALVHEFGLRPGLGHRPAGDLDRPEYVHMRIRQAAP